MDLPNPEELGLHDAQRALAEQRLTSVALVTAYRDRIERIDRSGPALHSVIELNPEAQDIARALDAERQARGPRGPLHGVPVLLKDNLATLDGMQTTAGSLALVGNPPGEDAHAVRRLRAAGAVILGKTNMSEWANIRSSQSISGWSARGGLTRNPYVLDRSASGSSSGSAAAVAASLCAAAVGTETDGSILSPSSACGIVGLKPTVGLISRSGIIPIAHSQDTAGPMARDVRDCALLLQGLVGADANDPSTLEASRPAATDYVGALDPDALRGARLGVVRQFFGFHEGVDRAFESVLGALSRAGAVLVDPVRLPRMDSLADVELEVLLFELKDGLNRCLGALPPAATVRSLQDVIDYNLRHAARELRWFGQDLLIAAQAKGSLQEPAYLQARALCLRVAREDGIDAALRVHRLDALIAPTGGPAWRTDRVLGDRGVAGGSTSPAAIAGTPSITVPVTELQGLPIGLSLFAGAWSEARLLALAYSVERATRARSAPGYAATLDRPDPHD